MYLPLIGLEERQLFAQCASAQLTSALPRPQKTYLVHSRGGQAGAGAAL